MKQYLLTFFLLVIANCLSAQIEDSTKYAGEQNPWISILDLEYDKIETVETVISDYWVEGHESKLFIFTQDDGVRYFKIFTPKKGSKGKRVIKEKYLSDKKQDYYTNLLIKLRNNNWTNIDKSKLNLTTKKDGALKVENGPTYRLRYIGHDYYKDFATYAPAKYIDNRFDGWMERVKLLNLVIDFNKMVKQ